MRYNVVMSFSDISHQLKTADRDYLLWGSFSMLLAYGAVMVLSATLYFSQDHFGSFYTMALRQWTILFVGLLVLWFISKIPLLFWRKIRWLLFLFGLVLLGVVLISGIGVEIKGARRWINVLGFSFQPSEYMKFAFIVFMAGYIEKFAIPLREERFNAIKIVFFPLAIVLLLLFFEKDGGAIAGVVFIIMGMMFFAGAHLLGYLVLVALILCLFVGLVVFEEYRLTRFLTFWDPLQHYLGDGYQVTHSIMAITQGGLFGVGLGNSVQKTGFLPDEYSDFIIAVIIEETGFFGLLFLLLLYGVLLWRMFILSTQAWKQGHLFLGSLPLGVGLWVVFQIMVNLGTAFGLLPPKGLILPFISYGGTNLLMMCVSFGLILRADIELRRRQNTAHSPSYSVSP